MAGTLPSTGTGGSGPATGGPGGNPSSTSAPTSPLDASPVPPAPTIPSITAPSPAATTTTKLPRLLKATYLTSGEKLLWETRPTRWHFLPGPVLVFALVIILDCILLGSAGVGSFSFARVLPSSLDASAGSTLAIIYEIVAVVLLLIAVWFFGDRWLHFASTVYVVTSTRVIRQKGIAQKDFDEVQLLQIRGVDVKQHVLQRILRYGTVKVSAEFGGTGQAMGNEDWPGVPRPIDFERTIEEAQQRLRGLVGSMGASPPPSR